MFCRTDDAENRTDDAENRTIDAEIRTDDFANMTDDGKRQVLKNGTMFPARAAKLWQLFSMYGSLDDIPPADMAKIESTTFKQVRPFVGLALRRSGPS